MSTHATSHRSFLRHAAVMGVTFGLMVFGFVLLSARDGTFATSANAEAGSHIEIAATGSGNWTTSLDGIWGFSNGAPGDVSTGSVDIRSVDIPNPQNTTLRIRATVPAAATPGFAAQLQVLEMTLGGADLIALWPAACRAGGLTLAELDACEPPVMAFPPGGAGVTFRMSVLFDPATGNEWQGATTGPVTIIFTIEDLTPPIIDTATPTPSPSPSASPTATPTGTVGNSGGAGRIVVRHDPPLPLQANAFTLSIGGPGGSSGPGPELRSDALGLGSRVVSLVGPETFNGAVVSLDDVACVSDQRGPLPVARSRTVTVQLTSNGETVTCTFRSSLAAGASTVGAGTPTAGSGTPRPPSTGTGMTGKDGVGAALIGLGAAIAVTWVVSAILLAASRRRREARP